jgi:Cdc6-like AAA superfamily ATPase
MESLDYNKILNREEKASSIKETLKNFELNKNNLLFKRGIYVYGDPGTGKTTFVTNILKENTLKRINNLLQIQKYQKRKP